MGQGLGKLGSIIRVICYLKMRFRYCGSYFSPYVARCLAAAGFCNDSPTQGSVRASGTMSWPYGRVASAPPVDGLALFNM